MGLAEAEVKEKEDNVVKNHPKFVDVWAKRFLHISRTQAKEKAVLWGTTFLEKSAVPYVAERIKVLIKRGK